MGLASFGAIHYRWAVNRLCEVAMQTDKGVVLAGQVLDDLRQRLVVIPSLDVVERICAEAISRANRLLKIAREGRQMTAADLAKFEPQRRYATLVALVAEVTTTVNDEIVHLHDQIIGRLFNRARHRQQQFQESGKANNDKVRLYGSRAENEGCASFTILASTQSAEKLLFRARSVIDDKHALTRRPLLRGLHQCLGPEGALPLP